jgi:GNAT superfamily N-acetyltransferase
VEVDIVHIAEVEWVAPTLARWHALEWGHLYPSNVWNETVALAEFAEHIAHRSAHDGVDTPPSTYVALTRGTKTVVGSISLVNDDDLAGHEHLGPWLASLFVPPEHRGHGIGALLVGHATDVARRAGVDRLHLFTADRVAWYESMGWRVLGKATANGEHVTVMCTDLGRSGLHR